MNPTAFYRLMEAMTGLFIIGAVFWAPWLYYGITGHYLQF